MSASRPTNLPYVTHRATSDQAAQGQVGGPCIEYTAGGSLNVGDCVLITAANTVNRSGVGTDYVAYVGVVVGGRRTGGLAVWDLRSNALLAATAGEEVLVQYAGIANVVANSALGPANLVVPSPSVGRVIGGITAGQTLGIMVTAAAGAGSIAKMFINHR
jgi:hypothetical protein